MKPTKFAYGVALLLGGWALNSHALEFRATKEHGTVFYDAPSSTAPKRFVVSRDYPVEVLATKPGWSRVRDAAGGVAWVMTDALSTQRTVVVTAPKAEIRRSPDSTAAVLFSVEKEGVLTLVTPPKQGWVQVKHRDGGTGYALLSAFWGL